MLKSTQHTMTQEFASEMFYDGDCPLCLRETNFIRRLDRNRRVCFVNIASPDFDPSTTGKTYHELMTEIHGRLTDGCWVTGVEVFRHLYSAVGLGPLVRLTRLPAIRQLLDASYRVFARNRLRLTGRCEGTCAVIAPITTH